MVTVLMMEMSVVHVIYMSVVLYSFVTVSFVVRSFMVLMNDLFGVVLTIMNVVNVPVVLDGLVTVAGQMFVIRCGMTIRHSYSSSCSDNRAKTAPSAAHLFRHLTIRVD